MEIPKPVKCRLGCGTDIIWVKSEKGARLPLSAKPVRVYNIVEGVGELHAVGYVSHFVDCPMRDKVKHQKGADPDGFVITFGKHSGKTLAEIPTGYLRWIVQQDKMRRDVKAAVEDYLAKHDKKEGADEHEQQQEG